MRAEMSVEAFTTTCEPFSAAKTPVGLQTRDFGGSGPSRQSLLASLYPMAPVAQIGRGTMCG